MLYVAFYFAAAGIFGFDPVPFLRPGFKYPQINENPKYALYQPLNGNCRTIKDTSDSWIKNDKMECN